MPFSDAAYDPYFRRPRWEQKLPDFPAINMGRNFPDALEEELQPLPYTSDMFSMLSRSYDAQQPPQSPLGSSLSESPVASMPRPRIGSALEDAANASEYGNATPAAGSTFASGPRRYGGGADYLNMLESASQMDQRSRELTQPRRMRQYDTMRNLEDQLNALLGSGQTATPERMANIANIEKLRNTARGIVNENDTEYETNRTKANAPVRAAQDELAKLIEKDKTTASAKAINSAMLKGTGLEGMADIPGLDTGTAKDLAENQRKSKELAIKETNAKSLVESRNVMNKWRNALRDPNKPMTPDQITRGVKETMVAVGKLQDLSASEPDNLQLVQELDYAKLILKRFTDMQGEQIGVERPEPSKAPTESSDPDIFDNFRQKFDYYRQKLGFGSAQPNGQPAAPQGTRPTQATPAPSNALRRAGQLAAKIKAGTANPAELNMHNRLMEQLEMAKKRTGGNIQAAMDIAARTVFGDL